jgi:hypothetical protein
MTPSGLTDWRNSLRHSSLRGVLLLLLFANLAYCAWARFIDTPAEPPATTGISRLPQLKLASEVPRPAAAPTPPAAGPDAAATTGAAVVSGSAVVASQATAALTPASPALASPEAARTDAAAEHCVTIGPFSDTTRTARASALLRERGFNPRQRAEEGQARPGFWVFVGGLTSQADEERVVRHLESNGIVDAHTMPLSEEGRRVSVGFFSERAGAERRAKAVQGLGLNAEIADRKQAGTAYWVDLDLNSSAQTVPTDGLLALEGEGERLEVRQCPGAKAAKQSGGPADASPTAKARVPPAAVAAAKQRPRTG